MGSICSITVDNGDHTFRFETEDIGHANYQVKIDLLRQSRSHLAVLTPTFPSKQIKDDWIDGTLTLKVVSDDAGRDPAGAIVEFEGKLGLKNKLFAQMDPIIVGSTGFRTIEAG